MNIEIRNCNNIDSAAISIAEGKLNIKFAPNGTGKSTIARAIIIGASGHPDFGEIAVRIARTLREMGIPDGTPAL